MGIRWCSSMLRGFMGLSKLNYVCASARHWILSSRSSEKSKRRTHLKCLAESQHVRFSMKPSVARTCQNQFWWDAWVLLRPLMCLTPLACIVGQNKSAVRFLTRNKQKIIWPHVTVWGQMAGYLLDAKVAIWQAAQITQFAVVTHFLNSWLHGAGIESMLLMGAPVHKLKLRQNTDGVSWLLFVWNTNLLIGTQRWTNPVIPSNTAVI